MWNSPAWYEGKSRRKLCFFLPWFTIVYHVLPFKAKDFQHFFARERLKARPRPKKPKPRRNLCLWLRIWELLQQNLGFPSTAIHKNVKKMHWEWFDRWSKVCFISFLPWLIQGWCCQLLSMPRHGKPKMLWTETDHPRVPRPSGYEVFIHKIPPFANLNYAVGKIFPLYSPIGHICHVPTNYQHPWCTSYIHQWTLPLRYPLIDSTPTSRHIHWFIDSWIN